MELGWGKIKVSRIESKMSVDEIGAFITEKLEIEHAVQEEHKMCGNQAREVHEVTNRPNSPKMDSSSQSGKGGHSRGRGAASGAGRGSWKSHHPEKGKGTPNNAKGNANQGKGNTNCGKGKR